MEPFLHIVSFDIPFPPNYGGVIDVFYKIRALSECGIRVILHCFEYRRGRSRELEQWCEKVYYYPRKTHFATNLSFIPYIVKSRMVPALTENLSKDNYPVIFEGLHTCGFLAHPSLQDRLRIYRESNIEHQYYFHLFKAETNLFRKIYFLSESLKLRTFQAILRHASLMLTVSTADTDYLRNAFPARQIHYLPSFHGQNEVSSLPGQGTYALYQGKLSVAENSQAARFLVVHVWRGDMPPLIIAGLDPPSWLREIILSRSNIRLIANPTEEEMGELIRQAQINVLVTFQPTGLKLKLLNALYRGRFCLVNPAMITGTTLGALCETGQTPEEIRERVLFLFTQTFTIGHIRERQKVLMENYSDKANCKRLIELLTLPVL